MTLAILLSDPARADLVAIWRHTAENWGRVQARAHLSGIDGFLATLADFPDMGRERRDIHPPVRLHPYRSHLVIYRADGLVLDVLRVVHNRSDWRALLSD